MYRAADANYPRAMNRAELQKTSYAMTAAGFNQADIPSYDAAQVEPVYLPISAWHQHGPFALWLTQVLRPRRIVELGSQAGYSYFCFCQAVQATDLDTKCYAIDTWNGDEHTGSYGEEIYLKMFAHNQRYAAFSKMIRTTFDDALPLFTDKSIDLLHIDGRHFYEDVKHDFESWQPKLTDDAIVLFHDTQVHQRNFGVLRYLSELKQQHTTFEFLHGHGLGVVANKSIPPALRPLFSAKGQDVEVWRSAFAGLGQKVTQRWNPNAVDHVAGRMRRRWQRSLAKRWRAVSRVFTGDDRS